MKMSRYIPLPDQARLKELFSYDYGTGVLSWKVSYPELNVYAGDPAGSLKKSGYTDVSVDNRIYKLHRIVWKYIKGVDPIGQIDHINRDKSDNRIENLREVVPQVNSQNRDPLSTIPGASYHKRDGVWFSNLCVAGQQLHLGTFSCPLLAGLAYLDCKNLLHPKYSKRYSWMT
jgi:HNH endonuclease